MTRTVSSTSFLSANHSGKKITLYERNTHIGFLRNVRIIFRNSDFLFGSASIQSLMNTFALFRNSSPYHSNRRKSIFLVKLVRILRFSVEAARSNSALFCCPIYYSCKTLHSSRPIGQPSSHEACCSQFGFFSLTNYRRYSNQEGFNFEAISSWHESIPSRYTFVSAISLKDVCSIGFSHFGHFDENGVDFLIISSV